MSRYEIRIAGFGGQGVISLSKWIITAASNLLYANDKDFRDFNSNIDSGTILIRFWLKSNTSK